MNRGSAALAVIAALLAGEPGARAQTATDNSTEFSLERLTPPPGAGGFFAAEDADVLPHLAWDVAMTGSLMSRPIVLRSLADGGEATVPVSLRFGFELAGAIGLGSRYQVGAALPALVQGGDRLQGIDLDERGLDPVALGDLRLHGKLRLVGRPGELCWGLGVAAALTLPTGGRDFAGERGAVIEWRLVASRAARRWRVAIDLGPRFRTREVVLLSPAQPHGNELYGAVAAEAIVPGLSHDAASVLAEYVVVRGDAPRGGTVRGPSPAELRVGGRWRLCSGWSLLGGLGFGTTPDEVGSPAWRVVFGARYDTAPSGDLDRDGVPDARDRCRMLPEDHDGWEDGDGCPDLDDDGDGIPDSEDQCPRIPEDFDHYHDSDGCPER